LTHRLLKWLVAGATLAGLAAFAAGGAFAGSAPAKSDVRPEFTTVGGVAPQFLPNAKTIPDWTFQYTDPTNHVTYPITMVGANPSSNSTSTIHTVIVPLNVLLYIGHENYTNCCILGYHGAGMPIGHGAGSANGSGKQPVQTFIYGAWTTPGTYSGFLQDYTNPTRTAPNPVRGLADIHALSHEVSEWLDDPYVNNAVQPWLTPTAPQYGCTGVLETGDPVVGVVPVQREHRRQRGRLQLLRPVPPRGRGQRPVVRPRRCRVGDRSRL